MEASGNVIYNTLVKPANKVVDYATIYSGITEDLLAPVTTTLVDVQRRLSEIVDYDTVLVGHSLNCDLVVLKVGLTLPFFSNSSADLVVCSSFLIRGSLIPLLFISIRVGRRTKPH